MPRLTKLEWDAVQTVLAERVAGGSQDFADAIGMSEEAAELIFERLERVLEKLAGGRRE